MTQVDFYILKDGVSGDRFTLACRIVDKARAAGHRVFVHSAHPEARAEIDQRLWTHRPAGFVPHGQLESVDIALTSVIIGDAQSAHDEHDVLINLDAEIPSAFSRFNRLAECVDHDEDVRKSSRERYRWYRDRGYPLQVHNIG